MKKNLIYSGMIAAALLFAGTKTNAQTDWHTTGNGGNATQFLGTTAGTGNNFDLRIKTNNVQRMVIKQNGKIGVGISTPKYKLDVQGGTGANDTIVINSVVKFTGTKDAIAIQGTSQPNPGYGIGVQGNGNFIGVSGFGAIGVDGFSAGADTTVLNTGNLFGVSGYVNTAAAAVGVIGEADNGNFAYGVYGTTNSGGTTDTAGTKHWALFGDGDVFGVRFFQASDSKLKENITPIRSATEKLMQLTPSTYSFKKNTGLVLPSGKEYGLLSENVEKVFPELIKEGRTVARTDKNHKKNGQEVTFKSVNYSGLIPVLIESAKEQKLAIDAKDAQIANLNAKLSLLENRLSALEGTSSAKLSSVNTMGASLEQNNPNPFNQSTEIRYSVPADYSSAKLIISSVDGKAVRTYTLSGKGQGQVTLNANELAVGSYTYTLNIDGKVVDSKSMVLTK